MAGLYIFTLLISPFFSSPLSLDKFQALDAAKVPISEHQVIIPKIGVNIQYLEGTSKTLQKGAWHRFPERGNPQIGGNFILSAHRFEIGWTPQQTRQKSPFYNIGNIDQGDIIYIDFKGKRYTYEVKRRYKVKPEAVSIEAPSDVAKLTLYSCTLKGAADGRDVIEAVISEPPRQASI